MTAILITALFTASAILAIAAIECTARRYGPVALALRQALRACPHHREVTVTTRRIGIRRAAVILRPDFRGRERSRPAMHPLPAAA